MMSAGTEPPSASLPEHTGKVSVKKKAAPNGLSGRALDSLAVNHEHTRSHWLSSFAFIVPSRRAAAV